MEKTDYREHEPLLQWLIGISLLAFTGFIAVHEGLFTVLVENDRSRLSLIIIAGFVMVNLQIVKQVLFISQERNAAAHLRQLLTTSNSVSVIINKGQISCCGENLTPSYISRHLKNLNSRLAITPTLQESGGIQTHLLSALDKRIRSGHKYGWLLADLMIKLGLIGTVIGFIFMLSSVATIEDYDITTMQDLLRSMSGGMRVALYTTLSGLTAGLLLGIQYQFLDHQADQLLAEIEELSEVYILPALLNKAGDTGGEE